MIIPEFQPEKADPPWAEILEFPNYEKFCSSFVKNYRNKKAYRYINRKYFITGDSKMKRLLIVLAMMLLANFASAEEMKSEKHIVAGGADAFPYSTPAQRPNQLKNFSGYPFQLGKSFNEVGLTAGGYGNSNDLRGGYFIAEANHWSEWKDAGRNLSFLGAFIMYEPGEVGDYNWKKVKVMYQPGLYEILDEHESYHLLLKPRIGVSINRGAEKETNFAYGLYSEFDKVFNPLNRAGIILDLLFESRDIGEDGYVNPRIFYEFGWANGVTLMPSIGPIWHVSPDETTIGITPALSLRIPLNSDLALQFAGTADLTNEKDRADTYGAYISLTWNDIMHVFQKN